MSLGPADAGLVGYINRVVIAFNPTTGRISSVIPISGNITTSQAQDGCEYRVQVNQDAIVLTRDFVLDDRQTPATRVVLDACSGEIVDLR